MGKHTPGPWAVDETTNAGWANTKVADVACIRTSIVVPRHDIEAGEALANACLIAAAPELLENQKLALAWITNLVSAFGEKAVIDQMPNNWGGRMAMSVAIARVKGE